ncbi:PR domain zinc finger protein 10-like isoform X2 [Corvus moneduloides]|uniref:PR domain zinc finger protein 10-like isoform X2 n=1 Tax=Corvus moneduloides TaxID=1196302 RepID=UPI0013631F70|nr:PR domain zinc finger protein 10-like isoform X2 [Corvus moneduloides]XP_031989549.1 PR domain zinc finger protein 10-like isoform X2 [Corvus moneduloides]
MEHPGREEMDLKEESPQVWAESAAQEQNTAQVHFVPEAGTVAQIVYSDEQERGPAQQVVYTADGTSYTSVDTSEHTLVYIHPVEATQARVVLSPPWFWHLENTTILFGMKASYQPSGMTGK